MAFKKGSERPAVNTGRGHMHADAVDRKQEKRHQHAVSQFRYF
jgi:hypothetical protein